MTLPLRMRFRLPVAAAIVAALALPASAAADWSTVSEPPLTEPLYGFEPDNIGVTDSPGGDYAPGITNEVTSNAVTLAPGYASCELNYWRAVHRAAGDTFRIEVLLNGVVRASGNPQNGTEQPGRIGLDSQFNAGGQVEIRLRLTSDSNPATVHDGIHMDDIRLICHGSPSDDGYEFLDGTSMATPMVSGAAALLFSQTPALTPSEVKDSLLNSVDPVPDLAGTTVSGGRLNVHRALIGDFNPSGGGGGGSTAGAGGGGGSTADFGSQPDPAPDSTAGEGASMVSDEVLVRYEQGSSLPERSDARADAGTVAVEGLGMARAQLLRIEDEDSVAETVRQLENQPGVAFAEPNEIQRPAVVPDDTLFGLQWGLYNDGQTVNGVSGTFDADLDAPEAWNILTGDPPGPPGTVVAVMDTGADLGHVDLANEIWTNVDEIPGNTLDDDGNGYVDDVNGFDFVGAEDGDPTDESGHGTHVSGIALAEGDNGAGVTGVSQHAALMTLRICQPILQSGAWSATCSTADEIQAINYAGDNGARVLNGSIEGPTFSLLAQQAMANHPEVLYVFAAGNHGSDNDTTPTYPCANDEVGGYSQNNVICVAATNQDDELAGFSNYGVDSVDLGAPGVDILSTSSQASFFSDDFEAGDFDSKWVNNSGSGSGTGGGEGSDTAESGTSASGAANSKPNAFFKRKPGKVVRTPGEKAKVVFRFGSSESGSSFRCRLDSPVYVPCAKKVVRFLEPARHMLKVKAVDSDGTVDPTPAVAKFRVKRIGD